MKGFIVKYTIEGSEGWKLNGTGDRVCMYYDAAQRSVVYWSKRIEKAFKKLGYEVVNVPDGVTVDMVFRKPGEFVDEDYFSGSVQFEISEVEVKEI